MHGPDELRQENAALRERISRLNAAILRINASLDLNTVLNEVVDSARALTGARYGIIATVDDAGELQEFLTSGLAPHEYRQMADWPHGEQFFAHLRDLPGVLRVTDLAGYTRSLGYAADLTLSNTLQATPMRHRGVHVGNFFLAEKEGGKEFTDEDEEVLEMFASQAATAIANARTHRDERRARADLEALVDTSPVGVLVFDARTGRPVSFNREARRLVGGLCDPGGSLEQLLEVMTCRRTDGRQGAPDEFPLALVLGSAETVRAEEMELLVPDGRSVTTLVNCTPIQSADGVVESVVVTMQDLAPLQELERQRAEFLGMVSHELRAPLTSIKGSAATVLTAKPGLDPAEMREFFRIIDEQADHMRGLIGDLLDVGRIDAGTLSVSPEPAQVAGLVDRARNTFLSGGGRHSVLIDLPPDLPQVMADRRRIVQVLNNLVSNASRHAPESSPIRVAAVRDGVQVAISVADQGRGVAPERLPHLFRKHAGITGGDQRWRARSGRPRPGDLQRPGGGPWRPHPGRERRGRPGHSGHLHPAGGRGGRGGRRGRGGRLRRPPSAGGAAGVGAEYAHTGGGRRPADAALRPRRARRVRLRAAGDRRSGGAVHPDPGTEAPAGPA